MALSAADLELIGAYVTKMLHDRGTPIGREGIAQASTWDPTDGTVSVAVGSMLAAFPDTADQAVVQRKIRVGTTQIGDQQGPSGARDDRTVLVPCEGGYVAFFVHGDDDSPGAAAGERWICHRNDAGVIDAFIKHTNDGATTGDGLGGAHYGGNAGLTTATTKSGHALSLNDTAQTAKLASAGGHIAVLDDNLEQIKIKSAGGLEHLLDDVAQKIQHIAGNASVTIDKAADAITHAAGAAGAVKIIVDGAGNAISHVATEVGLGDLYGNLAPTNAALSKAHLTQFESDLQAKRLDDLTKLVAAMISAGVPNSGSVLALLATLVPVPVPAGSSIVRIK
jgi:hypothetical protein